MELVVIGLAVVLVVACALYAIALNTLREVAETVEDNKILISHLYDALCGVRSEIDDIKTPPSYVTDPLKKPKQFRQSEGGIIVPKTPDEIRAEHFKEIKNGASYGYPE